MESRRTARRSKGEPTAVNAPRSQSPAKRRATTPKSRRKSANSVVVANNEQEKHVVHSPIPALNTGSRPLTSTSSERSQQQHVEQHFEFGGPVGVFFVIFGLPLVVYFLVFSCNKKYCVGSIFEVTKDDVVSWIPNVNDLFSSEATILFLGWVAFHVLLERVLPGETVEGATLPESRGKLKYIMSGHLQFWVSLLLLAYGSISWEIFERADADTAELSLASSQSFIKADSVVRITGFRALGLDIIYDQYVPLITVSALFSFALSIYLYASSFVGDKVLAKGGNTGYALYDFFIGRELNPRVGSLDLKEFCELRPGLIGWFVINLGMAAKQYMAREAVSGTGSISLSMMLILVFQGFYVWDALYMEKAILTTMDITTDGFGYMLAFGDLCWVPFIYSLQARYLVDHDPELSVGHISAIFALQCLGFYIFRSANSEKDAFRRDPVADGVKHLKFMNTKRGTRLLTSGWWGAARKINYTGDWLMTFSWCLLCGFSSPVPYFQAVYFAVLLIHRANRDDEMCLEKYGDDWLEYKRRVPYIFIPYVF